MINVRCSSLPRSAACPGSLEASRDLSSGDSVVSLAGNAGHVALERYYNQPGHTTGEAVGPIDEFAAELDDMTSYRARWYAETVDSLISSHGGAQEVHTEVAMSSEIVAHQVTLTGHADLVVVCRDGTTLITDWKFNYLDVPRASENIQLMGYVWLWDQQRHANDGAIHACLSAGGNDEPFTVADYTPVAVRRASARLEEIVCRALVPDTSTRVPGAEQCRYCPAQGTERCPESVEQVLAVAKTAPFEVLPSPERCVELFEAVKAVETLGKKFLAMLKDAVVADPDAWAAHFSLQPTGSTRTITDAQAAYREIVEIGGFLSSDQFLGLVSVPIGKLEKAMKDPLAASGIPAKDQKRVVESLLAGLIEAKEKAPILKLAKGQ